MRNKRIVTRLFAVCAVVSGAIVVGVDRSAATHTPADKIVAAGSKVERFAPGTNVELMTARMRTSKPTDVILHVAMECSILTQLATGTLGQQTSSAEAQGSVRVWVEIDGQVVPIVSVSNPPQPPPPAGNDSDKVTFCSRIYQRSVTDREGDDSQDEVRDYIRTKSANSFNWLRLNMGAGVHTIVVKADLTAFSEGDPGTAAEAFVGNRSLVAIPAKLSNDAVVNELGTN